MASRAARLARASRYTMHRMGGSDPDHGAGMEQTSPDGSLDRTLLSAEIDRSGSAADVDPSIQETLGAPSPEMPIERGTTIGRYVVLDKLGSGTMGVVMSAFDPTLDRKVAIKLVRPDATGTTTGRQRLMREAQAMGRLAHPNVVTVFEVGTYGDHVYLAMEYVAGSTLAEWVAGGHGWRATVQTLLAAGHGLAAAHRADIVHRDFKPTNVLVAKDGRVRVADFGLATAPTTRAVTPPIDTPVGELDDKMSIGAARSGQPDLSMTGTGAILGTPAYMSPEQHRGQPADARADQFSFCVTLYEALYRELPFVGQGYVAYAENVLAGKPREAPRGSDVPARVRRVLLRGLALDPRERYPDLDALLADLAHDPAANRKRLAIAGGGVLAAGAAIALLWSRGVAADDPCAAVEQPLAGLWDAGARTTLQQAFGASGNPRATAVFDHLAHVLDQQAPALRSARREACVATAVHHEQSAELLDRRMSCIDQHASELSALIAVLSDHPDAATVDKSIEAASLLPPVAQCADRAALLAEVPLPPLEKRAQVAALDHQLDRVDALLNAGKYVAALDAATKVLPEADGTGHAQLRARTHFLAASAHDQLTEHELAVADLKQAGELASAAHDDKLVARAWIMLYGVVGARLERGDLAGAFEPAVAGAMARAGNTTELRGYYDNARGVIALSAGDYPASAGYFQASARELGEALGPNSPKVISSLSNAGTALISAGRYDEARTVIDRTLATRIELLGPDHPDLSYSHFQLGHLLDNMEQPEKALVEFTLAADIDAKSLPADSPHIATDNVSMGVLLDELDRPKEALEHQLKALAILELHPKDNGKALRNALLDIANTYRQLKQNAEAMRSYERALELARSMLGPDHPEIADILNNLALAKLNTGDHAGARAAWNQALAIREAKLGPNHPDVAKALGNLSEEAFDRGDYKETVRLLARAVAIQDGVKGPTIPLTYMMLDMLGQAQSELDQYADAITSMTRARDGYAANHQPQEAAHCSAVLAEALWGHGDKREGAASMQQAIDGFLAAPKPDPARIARLRGWLAQHKP